MLQVGGGQMLRVWGTEVPQRGPGRSPDRESGVPTEVPLKLKAFRKKYAQNLFKSDKDFKNVAVCRLQATLKRFHLEADSIAQRST